MRGGWQLIGNRALMGAVVLRLAFSMHMHNPASLPIIKAGAGSLWVGAAISGGILRKW